MENAVILFPTSGATTIFILLPDVTVLPLSICEPVFTSVTVTEPLPVLLIVTVTSVAVGFGVSFDEPWVSRSFVTTGVGVEVTTGVGVEVTTGVGVCSGSCLNSGSGSGSGFFEKVAWMAVLPSTFTDLDIRMSCSAVSPTFAVRAVSS
ncbi:hypothetical protein NE609_02055 [Anaerotruncus sp. DFI.9.16]|nr:hypothetical protein [Anaerotruncus sp. DFI.9.16]